MRFKAKRNLIILFAAVSFVLLTTSISATSWAYPFVVWDGYRYEVLEEYVEEIGTEIGEVTSYSDMQTLPGNFSNEYVEGTKYFSIKGVPTDEAIAVQTGPQYKKAVRIGEYKTGAPHMKQNNMLKIVVLSAVAGLAILIFLRRKRMI